MNSLQNNTKTFLLKMGLTSKEAKKVFLVNITDRYVYVTFKSQLQFGIRHYGDTSLTDALYKYLLSEFRKKQYAVEFQDFKQGVLINLKEFSVRVFKSSDDNIDYKIFID